MTGRSRRPRLHRRAVFWVGLCIPALLALYAALLYFTVANSPGQEISLADYTKLSGQSGIQSATLESQDNRLEFVRGDRQYWVGLPTKSDFPNQFLADSLARGIPVRVDQQKLKQLIQPATYVVPALLMVTGFFLFFLMMRSSASSPFLNAAARRGATGRRITFADVAGADEAVAEAREVRDFLVNPKRFTDLGAEAPRGILLAGPPGTGKTLLARAVAGEAGVPFFSTSGAEFVEMYHGVGAARVRDLFRQVRERAPAILFIDEIDALGRTRAESTTAGQDERDQTLNQLLVELDGFDRDTGVVLIGATNRPDVLDPALLRRGRFDRQIVVDRPDRLGRLSILEVHARGKRLDPTVDLAALATDTPGLTGADLASVLNEAALLTARRGRTTIAQEELEEAVERVINGSEGRTQVLSPSEKRAVAYHEAGHAVVALALPHGGAVRKISIVGRGRALGSTEVVTDEKVVWSQSELEQRLTYLMGGRAADEMVRGQPTTSAEEDLRRATDLARRMVCELGMSETLGRRALGRPRGGPFLHEHRLEPDYSAVVASEIDREIGTLLDRAFASADHLLTTNRAAFQELAELLLKRETLRADDVLAFANRVTGPADQAQGARRAPNLPGAVTSARAPR